MHRNLEHVSTIQQRIAQKARENPELAFTSLAHYMTLDWLYEAYRRTRKDGAAGVDGVTGAAYAQDLDKNLHALHARLRSGTYKAPPVRRIEIPKGTGGETRPIGIPAFEDKIVQRAVVMLMEPIFEHDFYDFSYGYRPNRGAHDALDAVWQSTMAVNGGWVLEVDVSKFFDTLDHQQLQQLVSRRVCDGALRRLIGKWLNAGVMSGELVSYPESGTPQGGVISPLLANIYLHYVLDRWYMRTVRARLSGRSGLIRYADDFVIVFENKRDAERVMAALPGRLAKHGLRAHPDKTRLIDFRGPGHPGRRAEDDPAQGGPGGGGPGTFDLLGFTHHWGKSRRGNWVVKRKTMGKRLTRSVRDVYQWCRKHRHWPVREQYARLSAKLRGHYGYYGVSGNKAMLDAFRTQVRRSWRKWLNRRNRNRDFSWAKFSQLEETYRLPLPSEHYKRFYARKVAPAQQSLF